MRILLLGVALSFLVMAVFSFFIIGSSPGIAEVLGLSSLLLAGASVALFVGSLPFVLEARDSHEATVPPWKSPT